MPSILFVSNVMFMLERGYNFYFTLLYPCLCDKQLQTSACSVYTISIVSYLSNNNNDLLLCGARIFKSLTARNMSAITGKIVLFFVLFLLNDLDLIRTGTHYCPRYCTSVNYHVRIKNIILNISPLIPKRVQIICTLILFRF